jgi:lipoyl(octanoyl) transferase
VSDHGVTSLVDLGLPVTMDDLDIALARNLQKHLGPMEPFQAFEPV